MLFRPLLLLAALAFSACADAPAPAPAPADPNTKRIALTYDDAPLGDGPRLTGAARTAALIEQWDRAETGPVAIFVTTQGFERPDGAERVAAYAAAGHLIANHSDTHQWGSRTATEAYIADIDAAEAKLSGFDNRRPWYRFPFLDEGGQGTENSDSAKRDAYRAALAERGLISGYVTVDTFDWHLDRVWSQAVRDGREADMAALGQLYADMVVDAANHYDGLALRVLGRRPAQVLLLHENDLAASFTVPMVAALRADGWTIIDPDEAFADPIADELPETLFSGMGRIAALAADAGLRDRGTLDHWSVSELEIEARVAQYGVFGEVGE